MRFVLPVGSSGADPDKDINRWAHLPGLCCQAAGGDPESTVEISAAWLLLYIAAHIVDDVEDGDLSEEISSLGGPGSAINVANGLFLSAALSLNKLHEKDQTNILATQIISDFFETILVMTSGQHRDINYQEMTLEQWWQVAEVKSGSFFSLASRCGAQLGFADPIELKGYSDYGFHLGVMLQIIDDIEDLKQFISTEEIELLNNLQKSLAVAYALEVLPKVDASHLKEWIEFSPHEPEMVNRIIDMLDQSGAGLYMLTEMERHYELGMKSLESANPSSPAGDKLAALISSLKLE